MTGWYLMHRGWMASADFQPEPFTEREAFLWSIEQAAFAPHVQWFNRLEIPVARGEFATSTRKMAEAFKWGEHRVRLFMRRMVKREKWTLRTPHQRAHLCTVISVCNYDHFQTVGQRDDAPTDAPTDAARTQSGRSGAAQQKEGIKKGNEGERSASASASPRALGPALPLDEAIAIWTAAAERRGWKPVRPQLKGDRRSKLGARLRDEGLDGWAAAIARAEASDLLGGPDPPGWFNFDFVLSETNFLKLKEGNYDRLSRGSDRRGARSNWGAAYDRDIITV